MVREPINRFPIAFRRSFLWRAACAALFLVLFGGVSLAEDSSTQSSTGPSTEPEAAGGPPLIRRLTESQYRATIADIFGPEIPIVGRFEHGLRADGLLAVGTSQAGISSFSFEQYDASARGVAAVVVSEARRRQLVSSRPRAGSRVGEAFGKQFSQHSGRTLFCGQLGAGGKPRQR